MRVLVLVLSSSKSPYDALRKAQEETWAGENVPDCPVRFYDGGTLAGMVWKLRNALIDVYCEEQFDFVFRTNSSSYVDRELLLKKAETLPRKRCYSGLDGGGFASGSGFFLSRDLVRVLVYDLPVYHLPPPPHGPVEDEIVGNVLAAHGVSVLKGAERFDFWTEKFTHGFYGAGNEVFVNEVQRAYHVRVKSARGNRKDDVQAMEVVHAIKTRR